MMTLSAWYGRQYYCIECDVGYNSKPVIICTKWSDKNCLTFPTFTRCCRRCFGFLHISEITCQTVYVTIECHVTHVVNGSSVQCLITYAIYHIVENLSDHQCFIEVKKRSNVKSWRYNFYDLECTQNTIDTETKRPVHEVNYCIAMSICDECPDDGSCDNCLPVHTFSGLGGQITLETLCKWAFDDPVNEGAVFIAHNSSNYDVHFILSYLITNGEYPEILANGGNLLLLFHYNAAESI